MLLLSGNRSDDSFNFYLQTSIAQWEPSFLSLSEIDKKQQFSALGIFELRSK